MIGLVDLGLLRLAGQSHGAGIIPPPGYRQGNGETALRTMDLVSPAARRRIRHFQDTTLDVLPHPEVEHLTIRKLRVRRTLRLASRIEEGQFHSLVHHVSFPYHECAFPASSGLPA